MTIKKTFQDAHTNRNKSKRKKLKVVVENKQTIKWRSLEKQQLIPMQPNKVPSSIGPFQDYSIFLNNKQGFIIFIHFWIIKIKRVELKF
jgi:hypothetical protein